MESFRRQVKNFLSYLNIYIINYKVYSDLYRLIAWIAEK